MVMRGTLGEGKGDVRLATDVAEVIGRPPGHLALADCDVALEVGQAEVRWAVAAEAGAEQREQRRVLLDRNDLTRTGCPVGRRKIEAEDRDLAKKRLHDGLPRE